MGPNHGLQRRAPQALPGAGESCGLLGTRHAAAARLWVVEQHQIDVVEAELLEELLDGLGGGGARVEARHQLRRHKDVAASHAALDCRRDALADGAVVEVDLRGR